MIADQFTDADAWRGQGYYHRWDTGEVLEVHPPDWAATGWNRAND